MPGTGLTIRPLGALAAGLAQLRDGLYQAPANTISTVDPMHWPSALQPVSPIAPAGSEPLGWQFFQGQNQMFTPRPDAEYSAEQLRQLATYDLVRVIIENTKDQLCRTPWTIQLKRKMGEQRKDWKKRQANDPNISKLTSFFEYPDSEHSWSEWARPLLEDMLVIDAPAILLRRTKKGDLAEARVLRGESITRYIDDNGWTPQPPDVAYAQVWYGMPRVNLTADQLVYKPRNIVPRGTVASELYGFSPVEQAALWIKTGSARLNFQYAYYKDGSIPGVVHVVPPDVTPDKIRETMEWMNSELAGDMARRHQWRMIQGFQKDGKPDQIIFSKEALLADPFDDLIIRCLCFAFGTSPQRLMRMMNRATAEANQDAAEKEGLLPWLDWMTGVINYIIQRKMGLSDYEISFNSDTEMDVLKQAQADNLLVGKVYPINEIRERRGDDSRPEPEADQLGVFTAAGFIPLAADAAAKRQQMMTPPAAVPANEPAVPAKGKPAGGGQKAVARGRL